MYIYIIAKFVVSHFEFYKLLRNLGFFCSVNHLSGPLRKHMFTCDWCISIHFVCFCVSRFAACDRPVSHCFGRWLTSFYRSFLWSFLFLPLANNKTMSASCPQQKFHSWSRFPTLFLGSLGSFSFLFLRAKLSECVALWFALTPPPTQMIDRTEKPIRSLQTRSAIQQIWL